EHPTALLVLARGGLRALHVGAHAWLGAGEGANRLASGQRHEPALLLLLGAERGDWRAAERDARRDSDCYRRIDSGEFFYGDGKRKRACAEPAVLLGKLEPHDAKFAELANCLGRKRP